MDKLIFPTLEQIKLTNPEKNSEEYGSNSAIDDDRSALSVMPERSERAEIPEATELPELQSASDSPSLSSSPVSAVMDQNLATVHAEDTIEKVEEFLTAQGLASVPVLGSDGTIVGMIGTHELALFHNEKKNTKVVRAWEISRCKTFEVNPTDSVVEVAKLMAENKIETIAVTNHGGLQGVVSVQDLVIEILKENNDEAV